jgi:hypothetical protein
MRKEQLEQLGFEHIKDGSYGMAIKPVYIDATVLIRSHIEKDIATISIGIKQGEQPAELIIGKCANRAADLKHVISWFKMNGSDIGQHIVAKLIEKKKQSKTK